MKATDYVSYLAEAIPKDALIVSSHTDNTEACIMYGLSNRTLLGLNMGFATPVGLGLAEALPHRKVIILEGDGGVELLCSSILDLGVAGPRNAIVIVADNESACGFPMHTSRGVDLESIAKSAGIKSTATVRTIAEFKREFDKALKRDATTYIVVKTDRGRVKLPKGMKRPYLWENKFAFVRHVEDTEDVTILTSIG